MLPALVDRDDQTERKPVSEEIKAIIYGCLRKAAMGTSGAIEDGHWSATYAAEKARASGVSNGAPDKSGKLIPGRCVPAFGKKFLEYVHRENFGKHAYYHHEIRGTRGATQGRESHYSATLDDFTSGLKYDMIKEDDWWVDVGQDIHLTNEVLWWRKDSHLTLISLILECSLEEADKLMKTNGAYFEDTACHLVDVSGFRLRLPKRVRNNTGIAYVQAYCTEKAAVYRPGGRSPHLYYTALRAGNEGNVSDFAEHLHNILYEHQQNRTSGNARIEVRVRLSKVKRSNAYLPWNREVVASSLFHFPSPLWW
jgi:hypothetical protein